MSEVLTQETDAPRYVMTPRVQLFVEDITKAICFSTNCEYKMSACTHGRLAAELMKAVTDYHAELLDKKNHPAAANILRSEM